MYIYKNNDAIPWEACVATLGFFDGVHSGHRFLLNELIKTAHDEHKIAVVVTFDMHPRKVLNADFQPKLLTTLEEKTELLAAVGIDACVVLNFTKEVSALSAYDFLKTILYEKLHVHTLLVGHDHRFGHNRAEGFAEYAAYGQELGMHVIQAAKYETGEYHHISSSTIRNALHEGNIRLANELLTYPYIFSGKVIGGFQVGRKIGFPTANLHTEDKGKIIPGIGVYAVRVHLNNKQYKGMMNIGNRPTLQSDGETSLEVNIIDFEGDIYNRTLKIEFIDKIRDEMKFKSVQDLTEQLEKDRETVVNMDFIKND